MENILNEIQRETFDSVCSVEIKHSISLKVIRNAFICYLKVRESFKELESL